jgi:D-glycero-D-manno-heptose 1,7-bisphosphate phosphatase
MHNAVFIDRDGVLNEDRSWITDPKQLRILPSVSDALRILSKLGYYLFVVTNQASVARGIVTENRIQMIHKALSDRLYKSSGIRIDDFYYCPHHPQADIERYRVDCNCRKPKPGMIYKAAQAHNINLSESFMVGDRPSDIAAGNAAGCNPIWVQTGRHEEPPIISDMNNWNTTPAYTCKDLFTAAIWISTYERRTA